MQKSTTKGSAAKSATAASSAAAASASSQKAAAPVVEASSQHTAFEAGMAAFHAREFDRAKQFFQAALEGSAKELNYAAKQHLLMCEQRLAKAAVQLDSAEDYYNFAVSLMNKRDGEGAVKNLEKALQMGEADYMHLAMAVALGMNQDIAGAARHLQRAIEIHPRNRIAAHNDPDFAELMQHGAIRELLQGGARNSGDGHN
jgi:tetratricopeptide (TPR) repeat protein